MSDQPDVVVSRRLFRSRAVVVLLVTASAVAACSSQADDNAVLRLKNDLGRRVALAPCNDSHCDHLAGSVRNHLDPGASLPVNVDADGVASYYRVSIDSASTRCMRLVVHRTPERSIVPLSSAVDCGSPFHEGGTGMAGTILRWAFLLGLLGVGLGTTARVTQRAYRRVRPSHGDVSSAVLASLAGFGTFVGGWLFLDVYWLGRAAFRFLQRLNLAR
jgi:hypothetical protein